MALIKSVEVLESLIPKRNTLVYMGMITHTPQKELLAKTVYALEVDGNESRVKKIYKVAFSLFASPSSSYLFVRNADSELTTGTPYIKSKSPEGAEPKLEDWDFKKDERGVLYINAGLFSETKIYFGTSHLDAKDINEWLREERNKNTVVVETVYV